MRIELKMNTFRIKAYAKINLGLDVLRRRPDGYHEVKMIMQTVDLYDDLEFTKLAEDEIRIFTDKEELPADQGHKEDNAEQYKETEQEHTPDSGYILG